MENPVLTVREKDYPGRLLTYNEAAPLMARLQALEKSPGDVVQWQIDVIGLLCTPEEQSFLLGSVPMAEIGLQKVMDFFSHAVSGEPPKPQTQPTST